MINNFTFFPHLVHEGQTKAFKCSHLQCGQQFTNATSLKNHITTVHESKKHRCEFCGKSFLMEHDYVTHLKTDHDRKIYHCGTCYQVFGGEEQLKNHQYIKLHLQVHKICLILNT